MTIFNSKLLVYQRVLPVLGPGCIQALKDAAGEEVLANAAAVVAMFTAMTMVVDATGAEWGTWKIPRILVALVGLVRKFAAVIPKVDF